MAALRWHIFISKRPFDSVQWVLQSAMCSPSSPVVQTSQALQGHHWFQEDQRYPACAVQENYPIYKMNNCMLSIGYTTPKRKIWSAYPPSRCGISDLYHSTIKGPPPSNNSIYDADCKKEQDNARFCSRQRDSWATYRLLQMLKSFLGPSVDHSTSLTGVASSSWIKCIWTTPMDPWKLSHLVVYF